MNGSYSIAAALAIIIPTQTHLEVHTPLLVIIIHQANTNFNSAVTPSPPIHIKRLTEVQLQTLTRHLQVQVQVQVCVQVCVRINPNHRHDNTRQDTGTSERNMNQYSNSSSHYPMINLYWRGSIRTVVCWEDQSG